MEDSKEKTTELKIENEVLELNKETNIQKTFQSIMEGFKTFAKTDSVVGEPIYAGDAIIVPIMELSFGMGVGDFSDAKDNTQKAAGGVGGKLTPTALLVLQNGKTRLMSIENQDFVSKILDMVPDFIDKLLGMNKISKKAENEALKVKENLERGNY